MNNYNPDQIRLRLQSNTFEQVAGELSVSVSTLKRYCSHHGIRKRPQAAGVTDSELDDLVASAIEEVGASYGKKMLKGYLDAKYQCTVAGEVRVSESLKRVSSPEALAARRAGVRQRLANPHVYSADYFGEKWHIDQNEKLVRYGVTVVAMTDGYSRKIVGSAVMKVKNCIIIYDQVYRQAVGLYGLPTQIRSDHGLEFALCHSVQQSLAWLRMKQDKIPVACTTSLKNLPIERFWVEVNVRVQYPLKTVLVELEDQGKIDITNPGQMEVLSVCLQALVKLGLERAVSAWNWHTVSGRGKPNTLAENRAYITSPTTINHHLPTAEDAASRYQGNLTAPSIMKPVQAQYLATQDLNSVYTAVLKRDTLPLINLLYGCPY